MKKALIRFYSANNLGDDLFVKIIAHRYQNQFTFRRYEYAVSLERIKNLMPVGNRLSNKAYRLIEKITRKNNLALSRLAKTSDLLVYIGGSIFIENDQIEHWQREERFYRSLSIPYYILGSNFDPYAHKEFLPIASRILAGAKDVCFRDKASYEQFKNVQSTRVATDVAFSLDLSEYDIKHENIAIFSIIDCSRRFDAETVQLYEKAIVDMTHKLIDDGKQVVYMSFCKYEGDETAIQRILENVSVNRKSKVSTYYYNGDLEEALALLARCEVVVAARFHAAILGLLFDKKVLPIAYSDKTTNILKDMNFPGQVVDIRDIDMFDGSAVDFETIPTMDVSPQQALAEEQFQELDKVLTKRK